MWIAAEVRPPSSGSRQLEEGEVLEGGSGTWAVPPVASEKALQWGVRVEFLGPQRLCEWLVPMATMGWPPQQWGLSSLSSKLMESLVLINLELPVAANLEQSAFPVGILRYQHALCTVVSISLKQTLN